MPGPTFDAYGMHARSCACATCEAGYRPTESMRQAAVRAAERARLQIKQSERRAIREEQTRAAVRRTEETIRRVHVAAPPTQEEQEEMRRMAREFKR